MKARLAINGLWWLREEDLDGTLRRVNDTFHRLGEIAADWCNWWRSYRGLADRSRGPLFMIDRPEIIRDDLLEGQIRAPDGRIVEDLGYGLSASAGRVQGRGTEMSHLSLRCCKRSPYSGFSNLTIELPAEESAPGLYDPELLSRTLATLADVWDPDWLAVWDRVTKMESSPWEGGPSLGWVNYLPSRTGVVVGQPPAHWCWFAARGDKQIFIHEGGPPDPNNPDHVPAFEQMAACIRWGSPPQTREER